MCDRESLHVKQGNGGVHFFDFCENYRVCPFTVVVFPSNLKQVGDIRHLQGKQIEIEDDVKGYDAPRLCSGGWASSAETQLTFLPGRRNTTWSVMGSTAREGSAARRRPRARHARSNPRQ